MASFLEIHTRKNVAGDSLGSTVLYTTEDGDKSFHPVAVIFEMVDQGGSTANAYWSFGTNSTDYNNVRGTTPDPAITGITQMTTTNGIVVPPSTDIFVKLVELASPSAPGRVVTVSIVGFYDC